MSHWAFVAAAYAVTILAVAALVLLSLARMRRSEAAAGKLRSQ